LKKYLLLIPLLYIISCTNRNDTPAYKTSYIFDDSDKYSAAEIFKNKALFRDTVQTHFNFNHSFGTVWLKLKLYNKTNSTQQYNISFGNLFIDKIDYWEMHADSILQSAPMGLLYLSNKESIENASYMIRTTVSPGDSATVLTAIHNSFFRIIFDLYVRTKAQQETHNSLTEFLVGLFTGILVIIIFFNIFLCIQTAENIYLSYAGYCFSYLAYIIIIAGYPFKYLDAAVASFFSLTPIFLLPVIHLFLALFATKYLNLKIIMPKLFSFMKFIIINLALFALFNLAGVNNIVNLKEYLLTHYKPFFIVATIYYYLVFASLFFVIFTACIKEIKRKNFLALLYLIAFVPIILVFVVLSVNEFFHVSFDVFSFIPYAGILEIILMALALAYRVKHVHVAKQQLEVKLIQAEMFERQRIARDLHDDIGASLSSAKILTDLAIQKFSEDELFTNLKTNLQLAISHLRQIIWNIDDKEITFHELLQRINVFAAPLLRLQSIQFILNVENDVNDRKLERNERNNLYLIFKECINNTAKYSEASIFTTHVYNSNNKVLISIEDNGKGFNKNDKSPGNGLTNIKSRATEINCELSIITSSGNGTKILIVMPQ
jgi:signal transduction histidine kinase